MVSAARDGKGKNASNERRREACGPPVRMRAVAAHFFLLLLVDRELVQLCHTGLARDDQLQHSLCVALLLVRVVDDRRVFLVEAEGNEAVRPRANGGERSVFFEGDRSWASRLRRLCNTCTISPFKSGTRMLV